MTRQKKVNLLNELLEIEEKNDIGNLTSTDRREFQQWVEELEQEPKRQIGKWLSDLEIFGYGKDDYHCSVCGRGIHLNRPAEYLTDYPFCHCGTDMRGVK